MSSFAWFFTLQIAVDSALQNNFFSHWILYESGSPIYIDDSEFLNRLILIPETQYIPQGMSSFAWFLLSNQTK